MDLNDFLLNECLKDFRVERIIYHGFFSSVSKSHFNRQAIQEEIESEFSDIDLTKSFNEKIIIVFDETMFLEVLIELQTWLSRKSCNIENIVILSAGSGGLSEWYNKYLKLFGLTGFKIIEIPWFSITYHERFNTVPPYKNIRDSNQLKYYFSYYGGTHGTAERDFLATMFSTLKFGYVDYMANFSSDNNEFDSYLEYLTGFVDRPAVDKILSARHKIKFEKNDNKVINEDFSNSGFQFGIDSASVCHVIRETINYTPYSILSEKTLRSFLHQQIPIPLGVDAVNYLTKLGFCMEYDIIDYSYQHNVNFYDRIVDVCGVLETLKQNYTLDDLFGYLNDKQELIKYNYNYIYSNELFKKIGQDLVEKINE